MRSEVLEQKNQLLSEKKIAKERFKKARETQRNSKFIKQSRTKSMSNS